MQAIAAMDLSLDEQPGLSRRGLLIVLSSPSGAGKSTISRMLLSADPEERYRRQVRKRQRQQDRARNLKP
jgi:guanylate kinase